MANKKSASQQENNAIDELNDSLSSVTEKVQNNQKTILWAAVAVAAVVLLILGYIYLIHEPGKAKANDAIGNADIQLALGNDSVALAQYLDVAENYGGDASNRAALQAAGMLYSEGKYKEALDALDNFSASDKVIAAAASSLEGDCYVNLDDLDKAIACFKEAISVSDENPMYTPFFMMKLARVYREQKNYGSEAEIYEEIANEYPAYGSTYRVDVEKLLKRAQLQAGE